MSAFTIIILSATGLLGAGLLVLSAVVSRDLRAVKRAGRPPREGQTVVVCGTLEASGEPLLSPIRRRPCVLYYWNGYHLESSTISEGSSDVVDYAGYGATPAVVRSGEVTARLGGFPEIEDVPERGIESARVRDSVREFIRFARFDELPKGEMIEHVQIIEGMWDGRSTVVKNFRRGAYDLEKCRFSELTVAPDTQVCVIGSWSRGVVAAGPGRPLKLYEGTLETVRQKLTSSAGCARFFGILLLAGSIALASYLSLS